MGPRSPAAFCLLLSSLSPPPFLRYPALAGHCEPAFGSLASQQIADSASRTARGAVAEPVDSFHCTIAVALTPASGRSASQAAALVGTAAAEGMCATRRPELLEAAEPCRLHPLRITQSTVRIKFRRSWCTAPVGGPLQWDDWPLLFWQLRQLVTLGRDIASRRGSVCSDVFCPAPTADSQDCLCARALPPRAD